MGVDRYFKVSNEDYLEGLAMRLMPDVDILPIDILQNAVAVYQDETHTLVKVRLDQELIEDMIRHTEMMNPLTLEGVTALGITQTYMGADLLEVYRNWPECEGHIVDVIWGG